MDGSAVFHFLEAIPVKRYKDRSSLLRDSFRLGHRLGPKEVMHKGRSSYPLLPCRLFLSSSVSMHPQDSCLASEQLQGSIWMLTVVPG